MDPLTALGLASNIVQFIDFTSKLISESHKLYVSASGAKEENLELESLARNLQQLAEQASPPAVAQNTKSLSKEEETLRDLSKQCSEVSDELLSVLQSLKVKGDHKKWKSFHQALRSVWKKGDIDALQLRLDRIGHQMGTQILFNQQSKVFKKLDGLEEGNRLLETTRAKDLTRLREDFTKLFDNLRKGISEEGAKTRAFTEFSRTAERGIEYSAEQRILDFLRFSTMDDRHIAIRQAHAQTFRWIFETSPSDGPRSPTKFVEWLRSSDSLYWVSGKPGSGKSTLMKYLYENTSSRDHLKIWADGYQLIIANFFFWNAGRVVLQKSQEGLLRSMLYQILRQCPDLIPDASPGQWRGFVSGNLVNNEPSLNFLTVPELLDAFQRICAKLSSSKIKFCFFIDGLDEYEGKPDDIIHLIELLRASPYIKMCISSRPWNEFEKVFGQDESKKLYIQDLTRKDIELYVRDTLEKDPSYQELLEEDDGSLDLVREIVDAARGVFLWVFLVVRSLLEGLTNADRIVDLQRRLQLLPTDLNKYFESILFTVDVFYRSQTAHMFQVTLMAHETLPLMSYWYIDQEDPELAMKLEVQPLSMQKTNSRLKQMRKRLNACCKGLLEVQFYDSKNTDDSSLSSSVLFNWKVDFLHRTVRDFLMIPEMQNLLKEWAGTAFDTDIAICQALLAQIKTAPQEEDYFKVGGPVSNFVRAFRHHAGELGHDKSLEEVQVSLLAELESTLSCHKSVIGETDKAWLSNSEWDPGYTIGGLPKSTISIWGKLSGVASKVMKHMV